MTIIKRGSQSREPLRDTSLRFLRTGAVEGQIVLRDIDDWHFELWTANYDYSGYVVVHVGVSYAYLRRMTEQEVLALP